MKKKSGVELDETLKAQKAMWRFQRFGLAFMFLVIVGASAGFLSPARETSAKAPGIEVRYQDTLHTGTATRLVAKLKPVSSPSFILELGKNYLEGFKLLEVTPSPERIQQRANTLAFVFAVEPGSSPEVVFDLEPRRWGRTQGHVESDGTRVDLHHTVFP